MNRRDLIAHERHIAANYRREAKAREKRYPLIADQLNKWADQSEARAEFIRCGPLFGDHSDEVAK